MRNSRIAGVGSGADRAAIAAHMLSPAAPDARPPLPTHARNLSKVGSAVIVYNTSPQKRPISPQKSPISPQKSPISLQKSPISPQKSRMSPQKSLTSPQKSPISPQKSPISLQKSPIPPQKSCTSPQKSLISPQNSQKSPISPQKSRSRRKFSKVGSAVIFCHTFRSDLTSEKFYFHYRTCARSPYIYISHMCGNGSRIS